MGAVVISQGAIFMGALVEGHPVNLWQVERTSLRGFPESSLELLTEIDNGQSQPPRD